MKQTGRSWKEPTGVLREVVRDGARCMVIELDEDHRGHAEILDAPIEAFHQRLGHHRNLPELVDVDRDAGHYVYATGPAWPLASVFSAVESAGETLGLRATIQLMSAVSAVLEDGSEAGGIELESHLGLTPWRVLLTPRGGVQVIGWGLAQVDVLPDNEDATIEETALYTCPPERLEGREEDPSADRFALSMMAAQAVLGHPLYQGDLDSVLHQAERGLAQEALHADQHHFDHALLSLLDRATDRYPDARHADHKRFAREVGELLGRPRISGPSLEEWADWMQQVEPLPDIEEQPPHEQKVPAPSRPSPSRAERWKRPARSSDSRPRVRDSRAIRERRSHVLREPRDRNALYPNWRLSDDAQRYRIIMEDGDKRWVALDPDETLACAAARVADAVMPSPVDASGRLRGWYRLWQGDKSWFGDEKCHVLDPDVPIDVEFVENRQIEVTVRTPDGDRSLTVGTAVHGQFLLAALVRDLELSGRRWALRNGERKLDPWQILDDWDPADLDLALSRR